ncbi:NUDIX hydrolase [Lachnospiraceae bacterium]|nr:NUDIX hydrolase [Lachnospiraceae bacterium]
MMEEFKRLNRELMYHGTIVDFYKDTIQVPNGNVVEWDFIGHKGAAAVLPVREDGKLLMVRQYRNALDRYTLEIPAGGLNGADEPTKDAAARELEEETGYRSENLDWLITIRTTVAFCNEKIDIYVARNLIKSHQHLDEDEFINVEAYSVEELSRMILEGKIEDSKTISAIMSYKDKYCGNPL